MNKDTALFVLAMPEEGQRLFEEAGCRVVYTGLGKVNAAYVLMKAVSEKRPSHIINIGTAGSSVFKTHELVECTKLVQRDMDLSPLGFPVGTTPFDTIAGIIEIPSVFSHLPKGICGTGDSFETGAPRVSCDVVDMEAYALAKICQKEKLPFTCVKYISDGSDANAHNDWQANLPKAAQAFFALFQSRFTF